MVRRILLAFAVAMSLALVGSAPAGAVAIVATPNTVVIGQSLKLSGDVLVNGRPGCQVPGTVTLISGAFAGNEFGPGQGTAILHVDATGHFSGIAVVRPSAGPATYTITARCGGGNLGIVAHVTATELPRTGASIGPLSDTDAVVLALGLVVFGGIAIAFGRRRRAASATANNA